MPNTSQNDGRAQVAILMCTRNGDAFLGEQLKSIADQSHTSWTLIVSDDGSSDRTLDILRAFSEDRPQKVIVRNGPQRGVTANFLSLACDRKIEADYFAFCDQDDIWHKDKLSRALAWLGSVSDNVPSLYCGRTELIRTDGRPFGYSPHFMRPPSFQNALVQSLGGGNTMVFNKATKQLHEAAGPLDVVLHDWWSYQLVSAAGGMIRYDPEPVLKYRQHGENLVGSNMSQLARIARLRMLMNGSFRDWNSTNIAALNSVPANLVRPENRITLDQFTEARTGPVLKRIRLLMKCGVYRQTWLGHLALYVATLLKRI